MNLRSAVCQLQACSHLQRPRHHIAKDLWAVRKLWRNFGTHFGKAGDYFHHYHSVGSSSSKSNSETRWHNQSYARIDLRWNECRHSTHPCEISKAFHWIRAFCVFPLVYWTSGKRTCLSVWAYDCTKALGRVANTLYTAQQLCKREEGCRNRMDRYKCLCQILRYCILQIPLCAMQQRRIGDRILLAWIFRRREGAAQYSLYRLIHCANTLIVSRDHQVFCVNSGCGRLLSRLTRYNVATA